MYKIVVRSKRDLDAVRAAVQAYYKDWNVELETLKGARKEKILDVIDEHLDDEKLNIILLGKEDEEVRERLFKMTKENVVVHVVPRKRVRNARISHLIWEIEKAKAAPKFWISWPLSLKKREFIDARPYWDSILAWGMWWRLLNLGSPSSKSFLIIKKDGGEHEVYEDFKVKAIVDIGDDELKSVKLSEIKGRELREVVRDSEEFLKTFERISVSWLRGRCERAAVPWSGGKDSTAALLIAKKACDEVIAIFSDTGLEFKYNEEYVEFLARKLKINYIKVYAGVKEEMERRGPPSKENRWCTGLKIKAIERVIREEGIDTVIVGDRDSESESRSRRSPERYWEEAKAKVLAPIKHWSAFMVEAYIMVQGLYLNPLYPLGFYRIGCYNCPFMRSLEKEALKGRGVRV